MRRRQAPQSDILLVCAQHWDWWTTLVAFSALCRTTEINHSVAKLANLECAAAHCPSIAKIDPHYCLLAIFYVRLWNFADLFRAWSTQTTGILCLQGYIFVKDMLKALKVKAKDFNLQPVQWTCSNCKCGAHSFSFSIGPHVCFLLSSTIGWFYNCSKCSFFFFFLVCHSCSGATAVCSITSALVWFSGCLFKS